MNRTPGYLTTLRCGVYDAPVKRSRLRAVGLKALAGDERLFWEGWALLSDEDLMARLREGDSSAFDHLVDRYQQRAYGIAYQMVGSVHDAEDLSQEAFIRVYQGAGSFRGESRFFTWFYRILVNLCLDHLRQKSLRGRFVFPFSWLFSDKEPGDTASAQGCEEWVKEERGWADPERVSSDNQFRQALAQALAELSPQQRAVFILRNNHELSTEQIAAILKTSQGTVKTHLFRAIRCLRERLAMFEEAQGREFHREERE